MSATQYSEVNRRPEVIVALPNRPARWHLECVRKIETVATVSELWSADIEERSRPGGRVWRALRRRLMSGTGWDATELGLETTPLQREVDGWFAPSGATADWVVWLIPGPPAPAVFDRAPSILTFDSLDRVELDVPSSLRALIEGRGTAQRTLWKLTSGGGRHELLTGHFRLFPFSPHRSEDHLLSATSHWPAMCIRDRRPTSLDPAPPWESSSDPGLWVSFKVIARIVMAALRRVPRLVTQDLWNVGIAEVPISAFLAGSPMIDWLPEEPGRFIADPFPGVTEGEVLVERFDFARDVGEIVQISLDDHRATPTGIGSGGHASYPFTFSHDGRRFCLPETAMSRSLTLYVAEEHGWRADRVILEDVAAVDPTIFERDELWWLFFTDRDRGPNETLMAFWSESPLSDWTAHSLNPIKVDVRSSRGAGTPFVANGRLYRPSQDCSHGYGNRIVINEVTRLDPASFAEIEVRRLTGTGMYRSGFHTLSAFGERTLVDGMRARLSLQSLTRFRRWLP